MERAEFNSLRKMVKAEPRIVVDDAFNIFRASIYDAGKILKVVVVMKCDFYNIALQRVEKIIELARTHKFD